MNIYETIFKPYITAKLTILDNNQVLQNMKLVGQEQATIAFDGGDGSIYEQTLYVLNVKGEKANQSLRAQVYTIDLIGPAYYKDKGAMVQQAFKGTTGTQAIQQIHSQFIGEGLKILESSLGMLSDESYVASSIKPFKAINDIRKRLNFAASKSGNCLYYRDAQQYVLGPLESLFRSLSPQETFIQKATWGAHWTDIAAATRSIISAVAEVDHAEGGSASASAISQAGTQEKHVFDFRLKDTVVKNLASKVGLGQLAGSITGLDSVFQGVFGNHGGMPNYQTMDSAHNQKQVDRSDKTERERVYAAAAKNGPKITIKVPIQGGINCTVGKGIFARLLPAAGDRNDPSLSISGGNMLVTDLCHELAADDKMVNGVTVMQCIKGKLN